MTVSTVSPWDELDPPQDDVVMMNSKGAVVMNIETLAKIATGQSPIKFDRLLDAWNTYFKNMAIRDRVFKEYERYLTGGVLNITIPEFYQE